MKTKRFNKVVSLMLVLAMLISSVVLMTVSTAAATAGVGTPPEIVITGDTDTWDKSTNTEPTETDADGVTILINTAAEFAWFLNNTTADNVNTYRLTKNLDMANKGFAYFKDNARQFGGVLDGAGFVISNLCASMGENSGGTALFGTVTGTIKNLTLKDYYHNNGLNGDTSFIQSLKGGTVSNVRIDGKWGTDSRCAGIANNASENALIENCVISGTIEGKGNSGYTAGIVGSLSNSIIRDCKNYASITKTNDNLIGGIVATASGTSTIERCENHGAITTNKNANYAGIVANAAAAVTDNVMITDCINYGDLTLTGTTSPAGGIIASMGINLSDVANCPKISGCVNYGNIVSSGEKVGGIAGTYQRLAVAETRAIINCANYGNVTGKNYVGGILGFNDGSGYGSTTGYLHIRNCVNYGDVTATESYAGGIAGRVSGCVSAEFTLDGSASFGNVTAATYAGAIFGQVTRRDNSRYPYKTTVNLSNYIVSGTVTATATDGFASALFGYATVSDFYVTAEDPLILNLTDVKVDVTVIQNGEPVEAPSAYYYRPVVEAGSAEVKDKTDTEENEYQAAVPAQYGSITGSTYDYSDLVIPTTALTDGTVIAALNTYAMDRGYTPWVAGTRAPELLTFGLKLSGATIALAGTMKLNLQLATAKLPSIQGITKVVVRCNDGTSYEGTLGAGSYTFTVDAVRAAEIGEAKEYTLAVYVGDDTNPYTTIVPTTYSPLIYAERMYENIGTKEKAVVTSMIQYAYAAEINAKGSSSIIEEFNDKTGLNIVFDVSAYSENTMTVAGLNASALNEYARVGATLSSGVNLVLTDLNASVASATVTVNDQTFTYTKASDGTITITDLHAGMILNTFTLTLNGEEGSIISVDYAIGNYLATVSKLNGYADLAKATALYMMAVRAYAWQV